MRKPISVFVSMALATGFIFPLECCNNNEKVNPCAALTETSADFTIMEDYSWDPADDPYWPYYACDTVATRNLRFTAKDSTADSYEWHIGAGVYSKWKFTLNFSNATETIIPVTLILKKKPNLNCFPNDNGMDTITHKIYFVDWCQSLVAGEYFGHLVDSPNDTLTITIKMCNQDTNGQIGTQVMNPSLDCKSMYYNGGIANLLGFKALSLGSPSTGSGFCKWAGYIVKLAPDNKNITINVTYYTDTLRFENQVRKKFIGQRKLK